MAAPIEQETRLFDPDRGETRPMRDKEEAHDYRYFPDPDLLPLEFSTAFVEELQAAAAGAARREEGALHPDTGLSAYDADVLVAEREAAAFFEEVARGRDAKAAANWVINELYGRLNKEGKEIAASPVSASQLGAILDLIAAGTISGKIAKDLFEIVWSEGGDPAAIVEARGMKQVTDLGAIEKVVDEIIAGNPDKAAEAKANPKLVGWFVGQAMKASGGKANPQAVNELLGASSASDANVVGDHVRSRRHRSHVSDFVVEGDRARCADRIRIRRASGMQKRITLTDLLNSRRIRSREAVLRACPRNFFSTE